MWYPMSSSPNPRKRPAPDGSPLVSTPRMQQQFPTQAQPEQMLNWSGDIGANNIMDPSGRGMAQFAGGPASGQVGQGVPTSTALARRSANRALVPTAPRPTFDAPTDFWPTTFDDPAIPTSNGAVEEYDVDVLEERALQAKRDAQSKRRTIPPFVQKLSSFLDESKNTDLIRWSEKGDSFIVLDEDEFAKTLIPELFKHNNYASFVRQLNMYGFHKKVGLSDNSMKASERKNKSPSEYSNPFFRRGHPNLLWLINKPKTTSSKKKGKKAEGEGDTDEEIMLEDSGGPQNYGGTSGALGKASAQSEVGPLQKRELAVVKTQIDALQQQQKTISALIERLRRDHNQLYEQAVLFQNMHERHENSINAILNFLANVFRKSLEDQGGVQNVQDLLASIIPGAQAPIPQGSVVDLGDLGLQSSMTGAAVSPPKRQQRLLPPIPDQGRASTVSPSSSSTPAAHTPYQGQMGSVTELFDSTPSDTATPQYLQQELQANPQERMMRIINDTNANTSAGIDLPDMAARTSASLSDDQRTQMLRAMAGHNNPDLSMAAPPVAPTTTGSTSIPAPSVASNTAGTSVANTGTNNITSLSPLAKAAPLPPSLQDIYGRQMELEALQRMQTEQAAKLEELSSYLSPLSPSGRIPGLDENGYFGDNLDVDQFLDANAFNDLAYGTNDFAGGGTGGGGGTDATDFNFGLDGSGTGNNDFLSGTVGGGVAGAGGEAEIAEAADTGTATDTPSEAATEEIPRDDLESPGREAKRQRRL